LAGEIDVAALRCFPAADDLAVGLSGMVALDASITRHSMLIEAGATGQSQTVAIAAPKETSPVVVAADVDVSACDGNGEPADPGGSPGSSKEVRVPVYEVESGCTGSDVGAVLYYVVEVADASYTPPAAYYVEDDCTGGTTTSYEAPIDDSSVDVDVDVDAVDGDGSSDCGGDSPDGYDAEGDSCGGDSPDAVEGDGCSGDGSGSDGDCGGDSADGADCGGDSGGGADCGGDSGGGADCGGDGGGAGCDGGGADCAVARKKKRRMPRMSILIMFALAVLTPLRRWSRPKR
jgi:hypothetical protein